MKCDQLKETPTFLLNNIHQMIDDGFILLVYLLESKSYLKRSSGSAIFALPNGDRTPKCCFLTTSIDCHEHWRRAYSLTSSITSGFLAVSYFRYFLPSERAGLGFLHSFAPGALIQLISIVFELDSTHSLHPCIHDEPEAIWKRLLRERQAQLLSPNLGMRKGGPGLCQRNGGR